MQRFLNLRSLPILIGLILTALSFSYLAKGINGAWKGEDSDFKQRAREWSDFSHGVYPNRHYTPSGKDRATTHTVYPSYALVMFAPFLASGNSANSRLTLEILSFAALFCMMLLGWRILRDQGWQAGILGASMGAAISGNCTALYLGQLSSVSSGLIAAQILCLQSGRRYLGGFYWAFAMIKPQIALPFAILFLIRNQWKGLLAGGSLLIVMTLASLAWTGWSPYEYLVHGIARENWSFMTQVKSSPMASVSFSPWLMLLAGIGVVMVTALVLLFVSKSLSELSLIPLSGIASMLGYVLFYHRNYDNQMLLPLMLASTAALFRKPNSPLLAASTLMLGLSLYLPAGLVFRNHIPAMIAFMAPIFAAVMVLPSCLKSKQVAAPEDHVS